MNLIVPLLLACSSDAIPGLDDSASHTQDDTGQADAPPWGDGPRAISGQAYFFDMPTLGTIEWVRDVEGARVFVWEAPELSVDLSPDDDHRFRIEGIPEGVSVTLAVSHPDYFPTLTATLQVGVQDLQDITFQTVSLNLAWLTSEIVGADASDPDLCTMATTVSAPDPQDIWADGEPDATVTLSPEVDAERGPVYFNASVIPDLSLNATSTDGGVIVAGVEPGVYVWSGHKDGVRFNDLTMTCVGGWATNASPPWGMNASTEQDAAARRYPPRQKAPDSSPSIAQSTQASQGSGVTE